MFVPKVRPGYCGDVVRESFALFFLSNGDRYCRWDSFDDSISEAGSFLASYSDLFMPYAIHYVNSCIAAGLPTNTMQVAALPFSISLRGTKFEASAIKVKNKYNFEQYLDWKWPLLGPLR
jgi:hypothetical protein